MGVSMAQPETTTPVREQWSGQYGFILAAIGSAVGLGNIWRFPGVAYENGGGAFLLPYVIALLTAGIPILLLDYSLGHRFRGAAPTVFRRLGRRFEPLGWFQVAISFVIATYYTVIVVWAIRYVGFSVDLAWGDDPGSFLVNDFLRASGPGFELDFVGGIFWPMLVLWVAVLVVMALGVRSGLELLNKICIPLLVVTFAAMVVRALFLPGAIAGLNAFFTPDWDALTDANVWIAAYGHIFFSLSIAFGIMVTYSSYMARRSNVAPTGFVVGFANSSFEVLAGIGVFATLGFMAAQQSIAIDDLEGLTGVGLSFSTFPQIVSMMPGGPLFGVLFFLSLSLAGITSLISILQVVSAAFQEKFGLSRVQASVYVGGLCAVISLFLYSSTSVDPRHRRQVHQRGRRRRLRHRHVHRRHGRRAQAARAALPPQHRLHRTHRAVVERAHRRGRAPRPARHAGLEPQRPPRRAVRGLPGDLRRDRRLGRPRAHDPRRRRLHPGPVAATGRRLHPRRAAREAGGAPMTLPAIIFMVLAIAIIWGGLAVAIVFLARHPLPPEEAPDTGGSRPVGGGAGAA